MSICDVQVPARSTGKKMIDALRPLHIPKDVTPTKYLSDAYLVINHCTRCDTHVTRCDTHVCTVKSIHFDMVYMSFVIGYLSDRLPS